MERGEVKVWDPFVRIFHWALVLSFTVAYASGEELQRLHLYAGYAVGGLVLMRMVWGIIGTRHARFIDFVCRPAEVSNFLGDTLRLRARRYLGHNPAGGAMIVLMLSTLLITVVTGIALYGIEDGAGPLATLAGASATMKEALEEVHEFFANLMLFLILLHLAGVLLESLIHHENLIKAMINGRKHA
jgi:cytochrome b